MTRHVIQGKIHQHTVIKKTEMSLIEMPPTAGDRILNSQSSENQEHLAMHAMVTESLVRRLSCIV
jgi:hypothetical protein